MCVICCNHRAIYHWTTFRILYRILRLKDTGIYAFWTSWHVPMPKECMEINKKQKASPRLSFAHLSSAFLILGVGYSAALIVFAFEKISFFIKLRKNQIRRSN